MVTRAEASGDICTCSAALLVTFAALATSLVVGASDVGRGGEPGCKSTRTELLPGRITRCESPATTSTSSGGRTVRLVVAASGGGVGAAEPVVLALSVFDGAWGAFWFGFLVA